MPALSLLIKPASSLCNLRCSYCFYHDVAANRQTPSYGVMAPDTLETVVDRALSFATGSCTFAFQGGEPTLAGLDFFRRFEALLAARTPPGLSISRALQTNGLLLDEEWAAFLAQHHYLVGLSMDGPSDLHDARRPDAQGKGTFARTLAAAARLRKAGVDFNILSVVDSLVARRAAKVYAFFRKQGLPYLQFIPCLDDFGASGPPRLTPGRWAAFLKTTFDLWYEDVTQGHPVSIRLFDNLLEMLAGYPPETCGMSGRCTCQFVVEATGDVFPCDFYVTDAYRLGNLRDLSIPELRQAPAAQRFIQESLPLPDACRACPWYALCRGGCRRYREPFVDGQPGRYQLCQAYLDFFPYAVPRLRALAQQLPRR